MDIVTLFISFLNTLLAEEEKFYQNPKDFYPKDFYPKDFCSFERNVRASSENFCASYLSTVLSDMNRTIYNDSKRKDRFSVVRNDTRTLISSVGDIVFDNTYYLDKTTGKYHYLTTEMMDLDPHERFTEEAEVVLLSESLKTSYQEATRCIPSKQKISKTTVMNKVHDISNKVPFFVPVTQKRSCEYLYIEADEDHVSEQHGRFTPEEGNRGFISKLIYIYEDRRDSAECKTRKELVNCFYFSGVYEGKNANERFWTDVGKYIEQVYDEDKRKRIFISGDGAALIKGGVNYLNKAVFCADKFHLMKYINAASRQMLDESDFVKQELYRLLYARDKKGFHAYTDDMMKCAENAKPIQDLQTFVVGNWGAIMRTFHNKKLFGCSAEGHVRHMLSERLSSRPMGWSRIGADRMSKLRAYEKNYGREKIIAPTNFGIQLEKKILTELT